MRFDPEREPRDLDDTDLLARAQRTRCRLFSDKGTKTLRLKNLKRQRLYIFRSRQFLNRLTWKIKRTAYCDDEHIIQFWDDILRFIATIKLKETTASDLFRRLNSYSKQHGLYQALKAFGQILKSHFILRVIDEPALRMAIERVLNGIEHVHRFTRAESVGNPREFLQAEKQEQEMAEACKRLIKNCIIRWNYLYLSQKLAEMDDPARREAILNALTHGSAVSGRGVNLRHSAKPGDGDRQNSG